jgi:hypothetical protein
MPNFRFGKHPAKRDYRTLRLKKYLTAALPAPPAAYDILPTVYKNLDSQDPSRLFPMDGNDQYGDCTIAALAHASTAYHGLVGHKGHVLATKSVVKLYFKLTGGVDSGLNPLDVMNYWRKHSAASEKILGFAEIDHKNHTNVKQAVRLFGGVYLGFQVQEACIDDFNAKRPWTPGPLTNDGHAVYVTSYDANGVTVLTWGGTQKATWGWWDECVDEAYAILPAEAKDSDFSGFDLKQLKQDLSDITDPA